MPELMGNTYFYPIAMQDEHISNKALKDMYETLPEVQAPINYIIDKLANIKYYHMRNIGKKEQEITNSKPLLVLEKPNQYQTETDFIKSYFLNLIVYGVGYINRIKPIGFGRVTQLYILPSESTKTVLEINDKKDLRLNKIKGYIVDFGNGDIEISYDDVIASYEANIDYALDGIRSRLIAAIMTSKSLRYNYEARVKMYRDRGAMGIIAPTDPAGITKEQAEYVRNQWRNETGITGNKEVVRVSQAPMTYTNIGLNVRDLQLNENKQQDFQTICGLLGLKPALFGLGNNTYNNVTLAQMAAWEDVLIPKFNGFLEVLKRVFKLPSNEYFLADYSDIPALQEDYEKKVNANSKAWNDGIITESEYREAIGYEGGENKKKTELEASRTATQGQTNQNGSNNT